MILKEGELFGKIGILRKIELEKYSCIVCLLSPDKEIELLYEDLSKID